MGVVAALGAPIACSLEAGGLPGSVDGGGPDVVDLPDGGDANISDVIMLDTSTFDAADASPVPTAASPLDLADAGLVLWVRGDMVTTSDGGLVTAWPDQSGQGHDLGQPNPAARPTAVAMNGTYNSQPTLHFAATEALQTSAPLTLTQPVTVLLIGEAGSDTSYFFDSKDPTQRLSVLDLSGRKLAMYSAAGYAPSLGTGYVGAPSAIIAQFNGANSALYLSSNTATAPLTVTANATAVGVTVGNYNGGIYGLQGSLAEVAIWSSKLSPFDVARINLYIKSRYAITIQ